jgi:hypothetical protein
MPKSWIVSAKFVHWVAESKWPFQIINDCGFCSLMKTGRPEYHIPSVQTLSHNVHNVFVQVRKQIAHMLQVSHVKEDMRFEYSPNMIGI